MKKANDELIHSQLKNMESRDTINVSGLNLQKSETGNASGRRQPSLNSEPINIDLHPNAATRKSRVTDQHTKVQLQQVQQQIDEADKELQKSEDLIEKAANDLIMEKMMENHNYNFDQMGIGIDASGGAINNKRNAILEDKSTT